MRIYGPDPQHRSADGLAGDLPDNHLFLYLILERPVHADDPIKEHGQANRHGRIVLVDRPLCRRPTFPVCGTFNERDSRVDRNVPSCTIRSTGSTANCMSALEPCFDSVA